MQRNNAEDPGPDVQEGFDNTQYPCATCGRKLVDPPPDFTGIPDAALTSTCESCGSWSHNRCYNADMRRHLLHTHQLEHSQQPHGGSQVPVGVAQAEGHAAAATAPVKVLCRQCMGRWSNDLYTLGSVVEKCATCLLQELQHTWSHADTHLRSKKGVGTNGVLQTIKVTTGRIHGRHQHQVEPRVVVLMGVQGVGKSQLLDTMSCSPEPDTPYTPLPEGWQPMTEVMRRRFKQPEPVVLEAALGAEGLLGGQPAFGADGALLGLAQEAEAGKRSLEELGSFYMGNSSLLPSKMAGAVLPTAHESQMVDATTSASIVVVRDLRHGLTLLTMTPSMLSEVMRALASKLKEWGFLAHHEKEMLKGLFGTEGPEQLATLAQATPQQLAGYVVPEVFDVLGAMGTPVQIKLPGKRPRDERLYLVHLLSQVCGQLGPREPWMWLVWMVVRGVYTGALPQRDALVDMAGSDESAVHSVIRRHTMALADAVLLVVRKDPSAEQAVQDILIRGGLLQKVADRKLALMVCMSDHNPHTYNDYLNDDKWAKDVERVWQHKEEQWRVFLQAQLAMKGTWREEGELEEFMEGLQVVTMRAVGFKALLGAWASGRLEGTDATQLGKLLQRTGATAYYSSLMRMLKEPTVTSLRSIIKMTERLERMVQLMQSLTRSAGAAPLTPAEVASCKEAVGELKMPLEGSFSLDDVVDRLEQEDGTWSTEAMAILRPIQDRWNTKGYAEAGAAVRKVTQDHGAASLGQPQQLATGLGPQPMRRRSHAQQEHNQLAPVVSWVSSITPKDLEPAVAYMAKVLPSRIKEAMEQHPAFGQQRALQLLQTLWLEYLLPLVAGTEEDTMQEQQEILEEVHTNLASHMQSQATSLLDKLQGTAKEGPEQYVDKVQGIINTLDKKVVQGKGLEGTRGDKSVLQVVLRVLHKHMVNRLLEELTNSSNRSTATNLIITRMRGDLDLLINTGGLKQLELDMGDLRQPAAETLRTVLNQFQDGAQSLQKLIVLMHQHQHLLRRYQQEGLLRYHSVVDRKKMKEFTQARANGTVFKLPSQANLQGLLDASLADTVDMDHLVQQLAKAVVGVTGQDVQAEGNIMELSLLEQDSAQQQQCLRNMLQRTLITTVVEELHKAPGSGWFFKAAGVSANQSLTSDSWLREPREMLAVLALLLRCQLRVRIDYNHTYMVPTPPPPASKKRPRSSNGAGSSGVGSSGGSNGHNARRQWYIYVQPPASEVVVVAAGTGAGAGELAAAGAGGAGGQQAAGQVKNSPWTVFMQLRAKGGRWLFDVTGSLLMPLTARGQPRVQLRHLLGREDFQYEYCTEEGCPNPIEVGSTLVMCDGEHCAVSKHLHHLPAAAQANRQWLCAICQRRGRSISPPRGLKSEEERSLMQEALDTAVEALLALQGPN